MSASLILGIPSKGRIHEGAMAFLAGAGLDIVRSTGARDYIGRIRGIDGAEVRFLSASEIATGLEAGLLNVGITGEDLLREHTPAFEKSIALLRPLGFALANVVVAVPQSWIDVRSMADLDDVCLAFRARNHRHLRVATKFITLTRHFFAVHGINDYRIVESTGATEAAPAAGVAEIIVDITSTGATLAANNLKVLDDGVMLRSEANLAASFQAPWTDAALGGLADLLDRLSARAEGTGQVEVRFAAPKADTEFLAALGKDLAAEILRDDPREIVLLCPRPALAGVSRRAREAGAQTVRAVNTDYVFRAANPVFEAFKARLDGR